MYRLYVDMDGTIAEYRKFRSETQYEQKGYYSSLRPISPVIDALWIVHETSDIEIFIISACPRKGDAIEEKNWWLDQYLSFVDEEHRIFTYIDENKAEYVGKVKKNYFLYDDYKSNLLDWIKSGGSVIKSLNGLNSEPRSKKYSAIAANDTAESIANKLLRIILGGEHINDIRNEVYLRNESLGLTIIINREILATIVRDFFPEYDSVEAFRNLFTERDWDFVKRYSKDIVVESNTSVQQMSFEFETFYTNLQASISKLMDAYKKFRFSGVSYEIEKKTLESKLAAAEEAAQIKGNKRRANKSVVEYKETLAQLEKTIKSETDEWLSFKESLTASITDSKNTFFKKYSGSSLYGDEEFEAACRHARERVEVDVNATFAAIE